MDFCVLTPYPLFEHSLWSIIRRYNSTLTQRMQETTARRVQGAQVRARVTPAIFASLADPGEGSLDG